jgi:hypothetical protein
MPPPTTTCATLALVWLVVASAACRPATAEPTRPPSRLSDVVLARDSDSIRALVPHRTTLSSLLITHQLVASEAAALVQTLSEKVDLRRFRAGQPYRLDRFFDGRVREFEYEIDRDRRVIVRRTADEEAAFRAEIASIPKTIDQVVVEGAITSETPSLVQAIDAAGEHVELSLALAEVFAGEMDFNSDVQPGDTFRLIVERATAPSAATGRCSPRSSSMRAARWRRFGSRRQRERPAITTPKAAR